MVCMCASAHMYVYVCMYACMLPHIHTSVCECMFVCAYMPKQYYA